MRLTYNTREEAQSVADRLHEWMINNHSWYRESVNKGQTVAYAVPYQDLDKEGNPIGSQWHINIKPRVMGGLTREEQEIINV